MGFAFYNYKVDAYGIFENGIKHDKHDVSGFLRNIKPFWLQKKEYNGIIIGTSRAHNGMDPDSINPYFDNAQFFNYGQSALSYMGAHHIVAYAESEGIENYIVLLDTYILPNNRRKLGDHVPEWIPDYTLESDDTEYFTKELYNKLFSINAFNKNTRKVLGTEDEPIWTDRGLNSLGYDRFEGGKKLAGPMRANLRKGKNRDFTDHKYETFQRSMDILCGATGDVILIYPPVSMYYLSAIEYQSPGVTLDFKKKTMEYIFSKTSCAGNVRVIDFMYPNGITLEDLRIRKPSQYYRDPSHFRASTGTKIMAEIQGATDTNYGIEYSSYDPERIDSIEQTFVRFHDSIGIPTIIDYKLLRFIEDKEEEVEVESSEEVES